MEKAADGVLKSREAHAKAIFFQRGVRIATGCDIFVAEGYGTSAKELEYLVDLGMTPLKAIEAATVNGVRALGNQAPLSGKLKAGYDADVFIRRRQVLTGTQAHHSCLQRRYTSQESTNVFVTRQ